LRNATATGGNKVMRQRVKRFWSWLGKNHQSIQASAAILAALLAVATIAGVKWQMDAAARLQKEQSARDIYREYLNISISRPEFAQPDYCALAESPQFAAYESYVAYLLYAGEQVLVLGDGWSGVMQGEMERHAAYLCSPDYQAADYDPAVADVVSRVRADQCVKLARCNIQEPLR
jgi:hypothetical protein